MPNKVFLVLKDALSWRLPVLSNEEKSIAFT